MSTGTAQEYCLNCGKMFNRDCGHVCQYPGQGRGAAWRPVEFVTVKVNELERLRAENGRWQKMVEATIRDWGDECDGLITQIGDLKEQIAAQAYVIGALKTQVRDSQQAGMTLQIAVASLYEQNDGLLAKVKAHGKQQQAPYPEYERLTAENEKLRKLLTWALRPEAHAALMAEYAKAGKVTEGCESNIPY
jgi:regulator of replication initiation timing